MRTFLLAAALASLASTGLAELDLNDIGMYLDPDAGTTYCAYVGTGVVHVYVVGTRLTAQSCKGVEFEAWVVNGIMGNLTHPPGVDFGGQRDTDHTIGYVAPEPIINGDFVFAEFDLLVTDDGLGTFGFVGPVYHHTLPQAVPAYLDGEDPTLETVIGLNNSTGYRFGWPTDIPPVLLLNAECRGVVPNEDVSFGDVKALFH